MNVCFRVDSSVKIGTGHLFRCLTLAEQLRVQGVQVYFASRLEDGHLAKWIRQKGFDVLVMSANNSFSEYEDAQALIQIVKDKKKTFDWIIVDHYQISAEWETKVKAAFGVKIAVIDDLANRTHQCELLLDQNYFSDFKWRYTGLVPKSCKQLLGPAHLILRPEFYNGESRRDRQQKRLLIFFGGSDPTNETEKALQALANLMPLEWEVNVVVGNANPNRSRIEQLVNDIGGNYYCQIDYLARLMRESTFALGAGGVTMWERCFVGLPSCITIVAENQRKSTEDVARTGAIRLLGWHEEVSTVEYKEAATWALTHQEELDVMREKGKELVKFQKNMEIHPLVAEILKG